MIQTMKTKQPLVSILTITYNQEKYIRQALESFIAQKTDFDFEVIVADDNSSDKTPKIIQEFTDLHPTIFKPILREKNIGAVPNMIDVLRRAKGKYIAVCEGDDYWTDPHKLQKQVDFLEENPGYSVCFHLVRVIFEDNLGDEYTFPGVKDTTWYTKEELLKTNYIPTNSVVYRKQKYDHLPTNVMPFDWYLHLYHAKFGEIKLINKTMSVYRKHKGGIWWEYDQNRDEIWRHHGISYLSLLEEELKLYAENDTYRKIILQSIDDMLGTLINIDEKYGSALFDEALTSYPDKQKPFIINQHKKLEETEKKLRSLTSELLEVGDQRGALMAHNNELTAQIKQLTTQLDKIQQELATIKNTKTWRTRAKLVHIKSKVKK